MKNIKNLSIISLIFGAITGILSLIPFVGVIVFLILIFCSSFIVIVFMKNLKILPNPNEQTGLLWGGISGFVSFIGFSITFLPCSFILSLIFKQSFFTGVFIKSGFTPLITVVFLIGLLCAMMNAFAGLASIYFFNNSTNLPNDIKNKFVINRKIRK